MKNRYEILMKSKNIRNHFLSDEKNYYELPLLGDYLQYEVSMVFAKAWAYVHDRVMDKRFMLLYVSGIGFYGYAITFNKQIMNAVVTYSAQSGGYAPIDILNQKIEREAKEYGKCDGSSSK